MIIKKGSKGEKVKEIQRFLGLEDDGVFGPDTEKAVKIWQKTNGLLNDGVVGPATRNAMGLIDTDIQKNSIKEEGTILINKHHLPKGEYRAGPIKPKWLFIHHTAGWHNPYRVIDDWATDKIGQIGTEFVLGGPSIKGDNYKHDGEIVQAFPHKSYAWHLGANGSQTMHINSIGIEVCNFGYLSKGGYFKYNPKTKKNVWIELKKDEFYTYAGVSAHESQIVVLDKAFRGYTHWHKYSDKQINELKELILHIGDRDSIDIRTGLPKLIKEKGADAFEWNERAFNGKEVGLWSHTNTRKDKTDMFPQQELMDMLVSL
jgi:hypothetical protein